MSKIFVNYGSDYIKTTYETLVASDIEDYLDTNFAVALKPNLVVPGPASNGAVTHHEVTEGIIKFLLDYGVKNIKIIESSGVGESTKRAFKYCGYEELSEKYGIPLIDLAKDSYGTYTHSGYDIKICDEALKTDFLINIPVLKAHCQTRLTCCLKNLKGCIPDNEKRRFHTLGIHKPVAALNALIKTGYCVVDGICGDLSFEEGGSPVTANRIIAGRDPMIVDSFAVEFIGHKPSDIGYLAYGREIGLGEFYSSDTEVVELNAENKPILDTRRNNMADRYRSLIEEDSACSVCYSSLIYALHKTGGGRKQKEPLLIGQGFKGEKGSGLGIGNCTSGFTKCVKGCPPKATDIIEALRG